uniref:Uncharacterized protein n=1 Tax=Daphnia galeata TaxID=27404 RepID=A0A8J2RL29_9CRUS|nr:unnamed protein product [Daphnia galeata]
MLTKFLFLTFIIFSSIEFSVLTGQNEQLQLLDARRGGGGELRPLLAPDTTDTELVFKCYSCDKTVDAGLCAINPMIYAKQIFCPKGELCSVERKESPTAVGFTKSNGVKTSGTKTTRFASAPANMSVTEVSIWRGCRSPHSEIFADTSASLSTHFCAKDLCNHGDGHLKCFECSGIGLHDKCMVNPSVFAKQVTCQPNEACYVERFAMDDNSIATTPKDQWVSRGCTQSDVVDVTKYRSNDSITVICRIGDFCNWMDARTIAVDSTSVTIIRKSDFLINQAVMQFASSRPFCRSHILANDISFRFQSDLVVVFVTLMERGDFRVFPLVTRGNAKRGLPFTTIGANC